MNSSQENSKIRLEVDYDEQGNPNSVEITPLSPSEETKEPDWIYNPQTGLIYYPNIPLIDDDEEFPTC